MWCSDNTSIVDRGSILTDEDRTQTSTTSAVDLATGETVIKRSNDTYTPARSSWGVFERYCRIRVYLPSTIDSPSSPINSLVYTRVSFLSYLLYTLFPLLSTIHSLICTLTHTLSFTLLYTLLYTFFYTLYYTLSYTLYYTLSYTLYYTLLHCTYPHRHKTARYK